MPVPFSPRISTDKSVSATRSAVARTASQTLDLTYRQQFSAAEDADWSDNSSANLHEALGGLDERSRDILYQRWLAEEKSTLHELAAKYNVSAERIRQLEKNAMNKLKGSIQA